MISTTVLGGKLYDHENNVHRLQGTSKQLLHAVRMPAAMERDLTKVAAAIRRQMHDGKHINEAGTAFRA